MKLFLVLNRISHSFALLTCEISWSTLEINFIFPHIMFYSLFNYHNYTVSSSFTVIIILIFIHCFFYLTGYFMNANTYSSSMCRFVPSLMKNGYDKQKHDFRMLL